MNDARTTSNARTTLTLASSNVQTTRDALAQAEKRLDACEPDETPKHRDARDIAAARLGRAVAAEEQARAQLATEEQEQARDELALVLASLDGPRTWEALKLAAEERDAMIARHQAERADLDARAALVIATFNGKRSRAVTLAAALGVDPPSCPELPSAAIEVAAALGAFEAGDVRAVDLLSIVAAVHGVTPLSDRHTGQGVAEDFPAEEQARAILDGSYAVKRAEVRASREQRDHEARKQQAIRTVRESIKAGLRNEGRQGARSAMTACVAAGTVALDEGREILASVLDEGRGKGIVATIRDTAAELFGGTP